MGGHVRESGRPRAPQLCLCEVQQLTAAPSWWLELRVGAVSRHGRSPQPAPQGQSIKLNFSFAICVVTVCLSLVPKHVGPPTLTGSEWG